MGFQINITETYLNNRNILLLHVNICFAIETTTGKLNHPGIFTVMYTRDIHKAAYNVLKAKCTKSQVISFNRRSGCVPTLVLREQWRV